MHVNTCLSAISRVLLGVALAACCPNGPVPTAAPSVVGSPSATGTAVAEATAVPVATLTPRATTAPDTLMPTASFSPEAIFTRVAQETLPAREAIDLQDEQAALVVVHDFLAALSIGNFASAEALYGGSYASLWSLTYVWATNPDDHVAVWETLCVRKALQCMPVLSTEPGTHTPTSFEFWVTFANPDGSVFTRGPCCGGDATDQPPVTRFPFSVIKSQGRFLVVGAPPYVP